MALGYDAACAALDAALDAVDHQCELMTRMERWMARTDRLTPFPWPGEQFVEPCDLVDLDYYSARPDTYPPGVREWQERFDAWWSYEGPCLCAGGPDMCMACTMSIDSDDEMWCMCDKCLGYS